MNAEDGEDAREAADVEDGGDTEDVEDSDYVAGDTDTGAAGGREDPDGNHPRSQHRLEKNLKMMCIEIIHIWIWGYYLLCNSNQYMVVLTHVFFQTDVQIVHDHHRDL